MISEYSEALKQSYAAQNNSDYIRAIDILLKTLHHLPLCARQEEGLKARIRALEVIAFRDGEIAQLNMMWNLPSP